MQLKRYEMYKINCCFVIDDMITQDKIQKLLLYYFFCGGGGGGGEGGDKLTKFSNWLLSAEQSSGIQVSLR